MSDELTSWTVEYQRGTDWFLDFDSPAVTYSTELAAVARAEYLADTHGWENVRIKKTIKITTTLGEAEPAARFTHADIDFWLVAHNKRITDLEVRLARLSGGGG